MAKKPPKKASFYVTVFLLLLAAILAAYGQTLLGILAIILGTFVSVWQYIASEYAAQEQESFNLLNAKLLHKGGLRNIYVQSIFDEIQQTGRAMDVGQRISNALKIEPDNRFALAHLAISCSLALSIRHSRGIEIDSIELHYVRDLCRNGRKLHPTEPLFLNALGVLADTSRKHRIARMWFQKAAAIGPSDAPYWRLYMAASYGMSGDHTEALQQIEQAQSEGVSIWLADFYMGRALCSLGRFDEAVKYLRKARSQRWLRLDIVDWLRSTNVCRGHFAKAVYYQFLLSALLFAPHPLLGLKSFLHAILLCFAVGVAGITTQLYLILSNLFPKYSELLSRLLKPDSVALSLSSQLVQAGNYVGGEQVCRRSLDFLPECYKLSVNLAICLAKQERRDEAIKELDKAIIRFPSNQVLLHNRNAILNEAKLNPRFVDAL